MTTYKALSLHQPHASLFALGVRHIETRGWSTKYRGPLAICAAKKKPRSWWSYYGEPQKGADQLLTAMFDEYRFDHLFDSWESTEGNGDWHHEWRGPLGAVVATCELVDVLPISAGTMRDVRYLWRCLDESLDIVGADREMERNVTDQLPYGDWTSGRYGWLLDAIKPLPEPIPVKGRQGLFNLPDDIAEQLEAA